MMNLRVLFKKEAIWYFMALIALFILVYMGRTIIMDTYFYVVSLNIITFLIPYVPLKITKALRYYFYVTGCTFFIIWFGFYALNISRSKSVKGYITEQLQVKRYTQRGVAGRSTSSGITYVYKGSSLHLSATRESEKLYEIYGDSVVSHLKVRLIVKETLPHVYYIDDVLIVYIK